MMWLTYLSITITTGLFLLLPSMNDVLFKSHEYSFSLQLFILQIPLISMIQLHHHALFLAHKNKQSGLFLISGLCLKLILVYPLTSSFGLIGASLSSLNLLTLKNTAALIIVSNPILISCNRRLSTRKKWVPIKMTKLIAMIASQNRAFNKALGVFLL